MIADVRQTPEADVLVDGVPAASLRRTSEGVEFRYRDDYLSSGLPAVATTLPLSEKPVVTAGGAVPPFFAGLLPEGRRLSALRRSVKTSADDELSLLLAVGADPVGAVAVIPAGGPAAVPTPTVDLSDPAGADFSAALTSHGVPDPVAMAGVQDKASARTIAVPVTTAGSDAILKISPPEYPQLVENEAACFRIGSGNNLRIPYADTALLHDRLGRAGLMVRRCDRSESRRMAVEDAAQLLGIWPAEKYTVSFEEVTDAITGVCYSPLLALRTVAFQLAMAWLTGNGDLHAKNLSVLHDGRGFVPSPVYDVPSTVPYGDHDLALRVGGSTTGLSRRRFLAYTDGRGLPRPVAESIADEALRLTEGAADVITSAAAYDARRTRDLTRVLAHRRRSWGA